SPVLRDHEGFGGEQYDTAAFLAKLPILFPLREDACCGEEADIREGAELFVGYVDCNSRWLYLSGFISQEQQGLGKPGLRSLGHDAGVTLHIPTEVMQCESKTILGQLRVGVCERTDSTVVPRQEFTFRDRRRIHHVGRRVLQQRYQSQDRSWNCPQHNDLRTRLGQNVTPGAS